MYKRQVRCGVSQGLPGFSNADAAGNWTGVDVDVCRAVAAAVLGDANKVKFTPLSAKERFTALTLKEFLMSQLLLKKQTKLLLLMIQEDVIRIQLINLV